MKWGKVRYARGIGLLTASLVIMKYISVLFNHVGGEGMSVCVVALHQKLI